MLLKVMKTFTIKLIGVTLSLVPTTHLADKSAREASNSFAKLHLTVVMLSVETICLKVLSCANLFGPGDATSE